jgi:hypothetical protein
MLPDGLGEASDSPELSASVAPLKHADSRGRQAGRCGELLLSKTERLPGIQEGSAVDR